MTFPSTILIGVLALSARAFPEKDSQLINLHGVLVPKWRLSNEELVSENAKCPPVNSSTMPCEYVRLLKVRRIKTILREPREKGLLNVALPEFRITSGARYSGVPQRV